VPLSGPVHKSKLGPFYMIAGTAAIPQSWFFLGGRGMGAGPAFYFTVLFSFICKEGTGNKFAFLAAGGPCWKKEQKKAYILLHLDILSKNGVRMCCVSVWDNDLLWEICAQ